MSTKCYKPFYYYNSKPIYQKNIEIAFPWFGCTSDGRATRPGLYKAIVIVKTKDEQLKQSKNVSVGIGGTK